MKYSVGQEVLLFNMRKQGRKGGELCLLSQLKIYIVFIGVVHFYIWWVWDVLCFFKLGRIEPDFSGPYTVEINGKRVSLANAEGTLLKNKYSADHIKPYKRTQEMMDTIPNERYFQQHFMTAFDINLTFLSGFPYRPHLEEAKPTRPSLIKCAPPQLMVNTLRKLNMTLTHFFK